jgi:hypothetical protein
MVVTIDYKISYFWCKFEKLLKFRKILPWFPTNKTKKNHTHNNIQRKHKKSIPWKKFTQKNRIEHIKALCI